MNHTRINRFSFFPMKSCGSIAVYSQLMYQYNSYKLQPPSNLVTYFAVRIIVSRWISLLPPLVAQMTNQPRESDAQRE